MRTNWLRIVGSKALISSCTLKSLKKLLNLPSEIQTYLVGYGTIGVAF